MEGTFAAGSLLIKRAQHAAAPTTHLRLRREAITGRGDPMLNRSLQWMMRRSANGKGHFSYSTGPQGPPPTLQNELTIISREQNPRQVLCKFGNLLNIEELHLNHFLMLIKLHICSE